MDAHAHHHHHAHAHEHGAMVAAAGPAAGALPPQQYIQNQQTTGHV